MIPRITIPSFGYSALPSENMDADTQQSPFYLSTHHSRQYKSIIRAALFSLLPSFVQSRYVKPEHPRRLHKTSFLDGLRGFAAFIVFVYHTVSADAAWLLPAYGMGDINCFMQLPGFRIIFSGPAMVHIFFVISGYVLSAKAVQLIRAGNFEKLSDSIFSSIFRRPFRLFLPSIAGIAMLEFTIYAGLNAGPAGGFYKRVELLLYTWRWDFPEYGLAHLWTIPIEFAGSILLFATVIGLSRARTSVRIMMLVLLMVHSLLSGRWAPCEFLTGILIAEVETIMEESPSEVSTKTQSLIPQAMIQVLGKVNVIFWSIALVFAVWVSGWSNHDKDKNPGLSHLYPMIPAVYFTSGPDIILCFWYAFASTIIVWSLFRIPILQRPFTTGPIQYLGDISYSIYIIHGYFPTRWRSWIMHITSWMVGGRINATRGLISMTMELVILFVLNLWVSDLFMRIIDRKSVQFARWFERICRATH
jgi:peptidoglycan/LPS O-acetylase OafA/YrhL